MKAASRARSLAAPVEWANGNEAGDGGGDGLGEAIGLAPSASGGNGGINGSCAEQRGAVTGWWVMLRS